MKSADAQGATDALIQTDNGKAWEEKMDIYKLDNSERQMTRELYEEIFSEDSKAFVDYYYTEKTKDNQIYAVKEDGQLCAMLHLNPYTLLVNGNEKQAHYIVAVATKEEYRKRGFMSALIKRALQDMYQAGETFTYLMPAAEKIYLPHDFRTVYEQDIKYYQPGETEEGMEVSKAVEADCEILAQWANRVLGGKYQIFARRNEAYYQRLIRECGSDGGSLMIYRKNGEITDCRLYYPDEEEPKSEKPKIMVRIVDVRRMLMSVRLKSLMAACFQITDPIIPENNRCVTITGTEFSGVMLMDSKPENSEGTITVAALASLLFGAKSVDEVCEEEGVQMSERMKGEMEKIVPLSQIYLNEVV